MNRREIIIKIYINNLKIFDIDNIVEESYILSVEELDGNLLPNNYLEILLMKDIIANFYSYRNYIVYSLENIETGKCYLYGILEN